LSLKPCVYTSLGAFLYLEYFLRVANAHFPTIELGDILSVQKVIPISSACSAVSGVNVIPFSHLVKLILFCSAKSCS
jgi:hypothetical protein